VLERVGIAEHFVTIQTADTHPSKPHPSMILAALGATGAEVTNAAMIGDTTFDIEMAHAAGVAALGVGWGYHAPDALLGAGARRVATDCAELESALEHLMLAAEKAP